MLARAFAFTAFCSICFAQMSVRGVVSGYVLDGRSSALRPVLGIPGSAYLGAALPLPWGVTAASVRASRDLAVGLSNEQPRRAYLLHALSGAVTATRLDAVLPDTDRVFLSGDGSAAAFVSSSRQQAQLVTGLAFVPVVSDPVALGLRGSITAVAVSNSGCALVTAADGQSGQVVELCAAQPGTVISVFDRDASRPTAAAWLSDRKFAVADAASNQVLLFALDGSAPTVLLDHSSGIDSPVGLAAVDSSTLAVAITGGGAAIVVARTDGSTPRIVPLPIAPDRLEPLDTPSILVSNALLDLPLLLVDSRQNYSAFFVPMN